MKRLLPLLTACFLPTTHAEEAKAVESVDFIRVTEDGDDTRLETSVTRFERDGISVELVVPAGLYGVSNGRLTEVRGVGLMLGLKCVGANATVVRRLMDTGLLSVPAADNVVRLLPPLIVGEEEIDEVVEIIDRSCAELAETAT